MVSFPIFKYAQILHLSHLVICRNSNYNGSYSARDQLASPRILLWRVDHNFLCGFADDYIAPPTNDPYGSMAIWLMALWLYRMTIWLMTVWRIPQCRGRLLGHTQGTPTVPRGPVTSSHCTTCSAAMCAVPSSRSPMECARLCSRIKGCSHPFYPPPSFTAGQLF